MHIFFEAGERVMLWNIEHNNTEIDVRNGIFGTVQRAGAEPGTFIVEIEEPLLHPSGGYVTLIAVTSREIAPAPADNGTHP